MSVAFSILGLGSQYAELKGPIKMESLKNNIAAVRTVFESRKSTAEQAATEMGLYESPKNIVEVISSLKELKEDISEFYILLSIAVTFPITTAYCERSFSVLKRIKNWLRTTCTDGGLGVLVVLAICSKRAQAIPIEDIIFEFMVTGPGGERKIAL